MKRVSLVAIVMASACGGKTAPLPPPPTGNNPVEATAPSTGDKQKEGPSCELAARMLIKERGPGEIPKQHWDRARTAGEAEVLALCLSDQWDEEMLKCFPKRASPFSCLSNLSEEGQYNYERRIDQWSYATLRKLEESGQYGGGAYGGEAYGGSGYGGVYGGKGGASQPQEEYIPCEQSLGDVTLYAPAVPAKAPDRDYLISQRKQFIGRACNMQWKNTDKKCFGAAKDAAAIEACRGMLAQTAKNSLANLLVDADGKYKKLLTIKKAPKQIECKAMTLSYYSDDSIRGKLTALDAAERKRVVTETREKMASACATEKWDATRRACVVMAAGMVYDLSDCFPPEQAQQVYKWNFPGPGVTFKTGIMACDTVSESVKKISTCTGIEQSLRSNIVDSYGAQLAMWLEYSSSVDDASRRCEEMHDSYKAVARQYGCAGF